MAKANRKARNKKEIQGHLGGNLHCPECKIPIICPGCGRFITQPKVIE